MNFDEKLRQYMKNTPVPAELEPENIESLLAKDLREEQSSQATDSLPIASKKPQLVESKKAPSSVHSVHRKRTRIIASIAACAVIAVGLFAHFGSDMDTLLSNDNALSEAQQLAISSANDYASLFEAMNEYYDNSNTNATSSMAALQEVGSVEMDMAVEESMEVSKETANTDSEEDQSYSDTNNQVEGVAEADIVKTDGEYIYYISSGRLLIVDANGGDMELVSTVERENTTATEMFLTDERLVVISSEFTYVENPVVFEQEPVEEGATDEAVTVDSEPVADTDFDNAEDSASDSSVAPADDVVDFMPEPTIWYDYYNTMYVEIYDISDKSNLAPISTYKQNGSYQSARMIDDTLYLVSNYQNHARPESEGDLDSYVPYYYVNDEKTHMQPVDICLPGRIVTDTYTIISGLDITQEEPLVSTKALMGYAGTIYASMDNIYITTNDYRNESEYTNITRFAIADGVVSEPVSGSVRGYLLNQFSMDEYEGNFRIATTTRIWDTVEENDTVAWNSDSYSTLYVLDDTLQEIGRADNLGKENETIQSVRFDGAIAYLVTFYQTDPLYKIDLTDPANPKILDELEVSGFSSYMHKWSDDLILGFGNEADEDGNITGLKLSMFDGSDETELVEVAKTYFNEQSQENREYSPAQYSHKAILVSPEHDLIGIPVQYYDGLTTVNQYFVFGYNEGSGFYERGVLEYPDVDYQYAFNRGLFIDDVVYALSDGRIVAARLDDLAVISRLDISVPYEETHYGIPEVDYAR